MKKLILLSLFLCLLFGTALYAQANITIGTGTLVNTTTGAPTPYGTYFKNFRQQYLYRAAEFEAAGGGAGPINSLAFNVSAVNNCSPMPNFKIRIKQTNQTALTGAFEVGTYTEVFFQNDFLPVAGWNTHTFSTPFVWDGTSNILVDIVTTLIPGSYTQNASVLYTVTTGVNTSLRYQNDTVDAGTYTGTVTTGSPNRANVIFNMATLVISDPPSPAALVSPANSAINQALATTLNWSAGSGLPTGFRIYFGTNNPPTNIVNGTDLGSVYTYNPGTLNYGTTYYWQVVPYNANGNATNCPVWSFSTMANPLISSFPWVETFGTLTTEPFPPMNWTQMGGQYPTASGTSSLWVRDEWLNGPAGNNAARMNIYSTARYSWLITPPIAVPANGYELRFDLGLTRYAATTAVTPGGQPDDRFIVAISDSPTMSNPTLLREWNNTGSAYVYDEIPNTGTIATISLDGLGGTKYIAFYGESTVSNADNDLFVDNVTVRQTPLAPMISVTPSSWDFGTKLINTTSSKQFTITNTGAGSLNVSSINVSGTGFALANPFSPVALLTNESANFTVNFAPTTANTFNGNVVINDNRAVTNIPLTGTAIDATIYSGDLPYLQNFDTAPVPDFPLGWEKYIASTSTPTVDVRTSGTPNSNPNHVYLTNSAENSTGDVLFMTPPIAVPINTLRTKFHAKGGAGFTVEVGTWNGSAFTLYQSVPITATYTQYSVDFSGYAGTANRIAYRHGLGATYRTIYIDDVIIEVPAPVAPLPATVAWPLNGMTTFVDPLLRWTPAATGEPALSYKVYLNQTGTFTEADLVYQGTALQFQTTGISADRTYYWKVLPTNNYGSDPTCPTWSFSTPGAVQLAESFDATTFPPVGWANGSTGAWSRSTATPLFHGAGHASRFTSTSIKYQLSTPLLTITNGDMLSFYTRATTISQILQIAYSEDRTTWTQLGADITYAATGVWYAHNVDLSPLAGNNYYLAFQTGTPTSTGTIYVDHVIGPDITPVRPGTPTLTAPANAALSQLPNPTLTWNAPITGGVPTLYRVYMDTNADPTTLYGTSTTTSFAVTPPLQWEQTYYWKVAAYNAAGEGIASDIRSFTVMADPTQPIPYLQDFEIPTTLAQIGWTGTFSITANHGTNGSKGLTRNLWSSTQTAVGTTPPIGPLAPNSELKFDYRYMAYSGYPGTAFSLGAGDLMRIQVSTDNVNFTTIHTIDQSNHVTSTAFAPVTLNLSAYSGNIYVRFDAVWATGDYYLNIDNVMVRQVPVGPPDPVTLVSPADGATGLPISGFNLTWAAAVTGGNPEYYELYMGPSEAEVYDYYAGPLDGTTYNPVTEGGMSFNYGETWYWMVVAVNSDDQAESVINSFTFMQDPRILSLPYTQNFDDVPAATLPAAWTGYVNSSSTSAYVRTIATYPVSAPNSVYLTNSADAAADLRLITPQVMVPMNTIKLSFSARAGSVGPNLLVGTIDALDGTGTFNQIASIPMTAAHVVYNVSFAGYAGADQYICFKHAPSSTYQSIYIDNIYMEALNANDLGVIAFSGDSYGFTGDELSFEVSVFNNGTTGQSSYAVQLRNADTEQVLASVNASSTIAPDDSAVHTLNWTPANQGYYSVYAKVVLAGDANPLNDNSDILSVGVFSATSHVPFVGNPQSTTTSNSIPFNMFYKNSVAETIYLAHELQMTSGTINAIIYQNNFTQDITKPVKVWMQHTTESVNAAWLPFANYTLVFEGNVHFPLGVNAVVIPLQTPFNYTGGNLAIRTNRVFEDVYWNSTNYFYYTLDSANPNRTRYHQADGTAAFDATNPPVAGTQSSFITNTAFIVSPFVPVPDPVAPTVQIAMSGSNPQLSWNAVAGAFNYVIYGSDNPYDWSAATVIATTTNLSHTITNATAKKFYKVAARSYGHQVREIGQVFNPASVIGFDNSQVRALPLIPNTDDKK